MPRGGATKSGHSTKPSAVSDKLLSRAGPALPARLRELEDLLLTEGILDEMDEMNKAASLDEYKHKIRLDYYSNVHCDPNDEGLTMFAVFTNMDRHYIALPEIWTRVPVRHGNVVALNSAMLPHFLAGLEETG
ncbi:hypothetical protein PsorP6_007757 [Peronosclerospora sorghi]|uniref:Uncharacterized protein n=1 Tax=Peronosclerospora sorghi TaxID=230839 RepID=A0ACC0W8Q3_9STRA|nr:hypothetical protein PsorP6_007757 [Peronosclerospora sorghi]